MVVPRNTPRSSGQDVVGVHRPAPCSPPLSCSSSHLTDPGPGAAGYPAGELGLKETPQAAGERPRESLGAPVWEKAAVVQTPEKKETHGPAWLPFVPWRGLAPLLTLQARVTQPVSAYSHTAYRLGVWGVAVCPSQADGEPPVETGPHPLWPQGIQQVPSGSCLPCSELLSPAHPVPTGTCVYGAGGWGRRAVQCPHPSLVMVAHVPSCPPAHADSPETGLYCRVMSTSHTKDGGGEFCCGTSTPLSRLPPTHTLLLVQPLPLRPLASAPSLFWPRSSPSGGTLTLGPRPLARVGSGSALPALGLHVPRGREADFPQMRVSKMNASLPLP